MVEPDHRSAEQQAGERPHRQVGLGTARAPLWLLIPPQLGMVRVAERCRGYFGCIDPSKNGYAGRGIRGWYPEGAILRIRWSPE
jgi:hypothetical protein